MWSSWAINHGQYHDAIQFSWWLIEERESRGLGQQENINIIYAGTWVHLTWDQGSQISDTEIIELVR